MTAGWFFIPLAGIQNDEALFAVPLYEPAGAVLNISVLGRQIPLMLMSYLGTFKAWLYAPLFHFWSPSAYSLRFPVVLAGGVTIWLFWLLLERAAGRRAAAVGCLLLATDATFLVTNCYDWGPVALQHLFLLGGMLCLLRFRSSRSLPLLAAGFLLFGLGLWDKALFVWTLVGLLAATVAAYPRELFRALRPLPVAVALLAFLVGAWPVAYYNIDKPADTLRSNVHVSVAELGGKARGLARALDGSMLLGYVAGEAWFGHPLPPKTFVQRISVGVSELAREPRHSLMLLALALVLLLLPVAWRGRARQPLIFALVFLATAWLQMALTVNAGGSAHHMVLLWPFPQFLIAVTCVAVAERWRRLPRRAPIVLVGVLLASNLLVMNQYHSQLVRFGATAIWSNAIFGLPAQLGDYRASQIFVTDWGLVDNLIVLSRGRLPIRVGVEPLLKPALDEGDWRYLRAMCGGEGHVFVSFVDGAEQFAGVNARLAALAAEAGYTKQPLRTVEDRNGRPVFQIFRFRPAGT